MSGKERLMTLPALWRLTEARGGNPIGRRAMRADDMQGVGHAPQFGSAAADFNARTAT
jgi:hypothetical protein